MIFALAATVTVAALAMPDAPPQSLSLKLGEAALVEVAAEGAIWSAQRTVGVVVPGAIEGQAAALQAAPEARSHETLTRVDTVPLPMVASRIRFSLGHYAHQPGTLLLIENGYGRRLTYMALLHKGGMTAQTTVCSVNAGAWSVESWPFDIDAVELGGFALDDTSDKTPTCG